MDVLIKISQTYVVVDLLCLPSKINRLEATILSVTIFEDRAFKECFKIE